MPTLRVVNATRGTVLGDRVDVADTGWRRMVGLLGRDSLDRGSGLLIIPSQAVHTLGMRFPIDVVFVNKAGRVVDAQPSLAPNRISGLHWGARCILELPTGAIAESQTSVGDELRFEE